MHINDLPISERFRQIFISEGIGELYPPQELLVKSDAINGRNALLSTPTASGKTFAAEILMAKKLEDGKKVVYVVPLRALAYEKYLDFMKYEKLGYRVKIEMGEMDSSKYRYELDFDILVTTAEKCDSILRSRPNWFENTGILIMDEIHLIASDRGPVYEILISKFRKLFKNIQILGLSATIGNPEELSEWLDAELIESQWRPVKLLENVVIGENKNEKLKEIVKESLSNNGLTLIFVNSRRSAESLAEKLGENLNIGYKNVGELKNLGEKILHTLSSPTEQCKRLSKCVRNGVAFHHAGITNKQRILIEDAFKNSLLKIIVATPTLAAGVNLPSRTVIVRDLTRYGSGKLRYIPVLEYKQQIGRAGRPKYDKIGMAFLIARNESERDFFVEKYINGEIEPIYSVLGVEPVLRFHILASIASNFTITEDSVFEFFKSTFFGYQYGIEGFENIIRNILNKLEGWGFIKKEKNIFLLPTELGGRVSELYIDPKTAFNYISILRTAEKEHRFPTLGLLEMLCDAIEIPLVGVKKGEESSIWNDIVENSEDILRDINDFDLSFKFLERFKTARILQLWIEEASEEFIYKHYNIPPGVLYQKTKIAEWLAYSASEISRILGLKKSSIEMGKMEIRLKNGIKEELIPLIGIKGVGRVRARKLFNRGYKKVSDLKNADVKEIAKIVGKKTAEKIMQF
ncbi:MAG: restriction endonuclease subunit R [Candidatus Altiarchaeales archaeon]|nr:MAG: restriction endonuclease subunit R [Candidatus Altiarchaeales archaeon]